MAQNKLTVLTPAEVRKELGKLHAAKTPLMVRCSEGTGWCWIQSIVDEDAVLLLQREENFKVQTGWCTLAYSPRKNFWKGFRVSVLFECAAGVGVGFPETIQIIKHMRVNPRFILSDRSVASFNRGDGRIVYSGVLVDISKTGARLRGDFSTNITLGSVLTNVTMTLRLKHGNYEEVVIASDAIVRWTTVRGRSVLELGVEFSLTQHNVDNLEVYLAVAKLVPSHIR